MVSFVGGRVFAAGAFVQESLHVEDGKVLRVGGDAPRGSREVRCHGLLVLPGAVDAHVHSRDPGFPEKETFLTLTQAAAAGGVTTVLDMPNNMPAVDSVDAFELKLREIAPKAVVDYGLFAVVRASTTTEEIAALADAGVVGFKAYLGYAWKRSTRQVVYTPRSDDPDLESPPDYSTLEALSAEIGKTGLPLVVHAEDPVFFAALDDAAGYAQFLASRADTAEAFAIGAFSAFAKQMPTHFHVAHVSSAKGLRAAGSARENWSLEVTPNHLWRTLDDYSRVGNLLKMFPPVRTADDRAALREALWRRDIQVVATDHAPHTDEEKLRRSLADASPGSSGVQTLVVSSLQLAHEMGDVARAVPWFTSNPARIFNLEGKGAFEPGADADITLVDPDAIMRVRPEEMLSKQRHSALDGLEFHFRVKQAYLRGEPVGTPGAGRLVRPSRRTAD